MSPLLSLLQDGIFFCDFATAAPSRLVYKALPLLIINIIYTTKSVITMSEDQAAAEFYKVYKASVSALAETWVMIDLKDKANAIIGQEPHTIFEWDDSDSFYADPITGNVVIVQKSEDAVSIEYTYNRDSNNVTQNTFTEPIIYSKLSTFNVGRAVKSKTFRDHLFKLLREYGVFVNINDNTITVKQRNAPAASSAYARNSLADEYAPNELPKICDYITTQTAVKLLKNKLSA
jgi:hypothetical protein